jgi:hypothetical protein
MLAPPEKPKPIPEQPAPAPEPKRRTITLTNRAPIRIIEDKWPVIAQGLEGDDCQAPWGWEIAVRVRHETGKGYTRYIIHANYETHDETREFCLISNQRIRVGRIIDCYEAAKNLWKHILEVGEELRVRINNEKLRRHVTNAVDKCFASLTPRDEA